MPKDSSSETKPAKERSSRVNSVVFFQRAFPAASSVWIYLLVFSILSSIGIWACATTRSNAEKICDRLQEELSDSLAGSFSQKIIPGSDATPDGDGSYTDGDLDSDFDEEAEEAEETGCCSSSNPCGLDNNGVCDCPEQSWDYYDCFVYIPYADDMDEPVCETDFTSCELSGGSGLVDLPEIIAEIELGWFDSPPPESRSTYETRLCFDSPIAFMDGEETGLVFGYDPFWEEIAGFVFVLESVPGFARMPIDTCGVVRLPGKDSLCEGWSGIDEVFNARGALFTFLGSVGPYRSFQLRLVCP